MNNYKIPTLILFGLMAACSIECGWEDDMPGGRDIYDMVRDSKGNVSVIKRHTGGSSGGCVLL